MEKQITKTSELNWKPLIEEGVNTDGIFYKVLCFDETTNRPKTFLLKFEAGASYPNHLHPGGEEIFVLEGEVRSAKDELKTGDYLYMPPQSTHSVFSKNGCTLLFIVPEEVVILN
ncbi:ChrR-like protein with cupin domain [Flavobacterium cutihirudinis]|uniref:ChrR-like protein with cupin domain n=1 Tax=Flavobacterium cutihirudinis TaxID=1265740 RepID=A0A3D9FPY6_9FLAO|nr:cupin domain-containing protein [Flavobacterium cutihirudinis]RED22452.1 ChrR-like protein with cupin domain [Flavobacterium cutihirudinis]